ncbi:DNA adenine methylase [Candidatus Latescibacterota bacterium]
MNAPICWLGGKSRLRKKIIERLPEHTCYVEVFGGAGWVLFGKERSKVEVYNDIDGELVNFFRVVKNCHRAFVQAFDWILVSRKLFKDFIETKPEDLDEIQRAVRFYYSIRASFGGKGEHFGYSKTGPTNLNLDTFYETISGTHERLKRVLIEEESFESILERYDGTETVFYLDPPYYMTTGYRYKIDLAEYERLASLLVDIQGKFILTINDHEAMRNVFSGHNTEELDVGYNIGKKTESRHRYGELMIRNYG